MRRKLTAVVLAVLVFSLIAASAASLGGITSSNIGADTTVVASCDNDGINATWGTVTYDTGTGRYVVTGLVLDGIHDDCVGRTAGITVTNDAGDTVYATTSATVIAVNPNDNEATLSFAAVDAELIERLHVTIG